MQPGSWGARLNASGISSGLTLRYSGSDMKNDKIR